MKEDRWKPFYDLSYAAWRAGRNELDRDRYSDAIASGYSPDEITLDMVSPRHARDPVLEEEFDEDPYPVDLIEWEEENAS